MFLASHLYHLSLGQSSVDQTGMCCKVSGTADWPSWLALPVTALTLYYKFLHALLRRSGLKVSEGKMLLFSSHTIGPEKSQLEERLGR